MERWHLLALVFVALAFRLLLAPLIQNPGFADASHYYNVGRNLVDGEGLTEDYVWHFNEEHAEIIHPIDHWMPLSSWAVALGMTLGGENIHAALSVFILAGALLPLLVYSYARQLGLAHLSALISASFAISLPDIVWNSLRTDTTILNMLLLAACIILLIRGFQSGQVIVLLGSGFFGGLAYLNRNDSLLVLPLFVGIALAHQLLGQRVFAWRGLLIASLGLVLTISPWLWRSYDLFGTWGTSEGSRMFFMVDQRDHYAYNAEINLETMLAQRTIPELISKRLFEFAAALKQVLVSLDVFLPVIMPFGLFFALQNRKTLATAAPPLLWMLGILFVYPFLIPYKSQSGSFEKAYLSILPLLLPLAGLAIERLISHKAWQIALALCVVVLMALNSFELVRQESSIANSYYARISDMVAVIDELPDLTGDGEVRLMTQDPYVLSYFGYHSIMIPLASRDDTLALAAHYGVDYLIMPAARPNLDPLYHQAETDPRFVFVRELDIETANPFEFYALYPEGRNAP